MLKVAQIKQLSKDELTKKLSDLQMQRFDALMQLKTKNLKNNQLIKQIKREIAQVKTVMSMHGA